VIEIENELAGFVEAVRREAGVKEAAGGIRRGGPSESCAREVEEMEEAKEAKDGEDGWFGAHARV
jgi:hypothetical protein